MSSTDLCFISPCSSTLESFSIKLSSIGSISFSFFDIFDSLTAEASDLLNNLFFFLGTFKLDFLFSFFSSSVILSFSFTFSFTILFSIISISFFSFISFLILFTGFFCSSSNFFSFFFFLSSSCCFSFNFFLSILIFLFLYFK